MSMGWAACTAEMSAAHAAKDAESRKNMAQTPRKLGIKG